MSRPIALTLLALNSSFAYNIPRKSIQHQTPINRATFLSTSTAAVTFLTSTACEAKEIDPAIKGTKADPAFQACLSQCVYECTKPKGSEQKSRAECLPECKTKCASTKEQLLLGNPK